MGVQGTCPQCGVEIEFNAANSLVVVCASCSSIIGRGDGRLETFGKVSDLVQTDSPLQVGAEGEVKGSRFEITGRTQYKHSAGGVWDEWYIAFDGGERWGWLAEAQGRYYLTFPKKLTEEHSIPDVGKLQVEEEILVPGAGRMKVVEVGEAELLSAEGEIPAAVRPGDRHAYADLQGPGKRFATLDGSESPPALYYGGEFPIERLGLEFAESREDTPTSVESIGVTCPNCGGSIELHAPHEAERFACVYCDSMLSVEDGGSLKFIEALQKQKVKPVIPLGTEGELRGRRYTVIGFMQRKVRSHGEEYPWTEYLLYSPRQPFHWLIHSQNHWTLSAPVSAGDVRAYSRSAYYEGKHFKGFDRSSPKVTAVYGEFYWKVSIGETVRAIDYVHPPFLLSREETRPETPATPPAAAPVGGEVETLYVATPVGPPQPPKTPITSREVNYTVGEYVPVEEISEAFGVAIATLGEPKGVAPNQPYLYSSVYKFAMGLLAAAFLAGILVFITVPRKKVLEQSFTKVPRAGSTTDYSSKPFELSGSRNIKLTMSTPERGKWAYLDGGFYNEGTGKLEKFSVGIPPGKAGTGRSRVKLLSALPSGKYTLRARFKFQSGTESHRNVKLSIAQGAPGFGNWMLLIVLLAAAPVAIGVHQMAFEAQRWAESGF